MSEKKIYIYIDQICITNNINIQTTIVKFHSQGILQNQNMFHFVAPKRDWNNHRDPLATHSDGHTTNIYILCEDGDCLKSDFKRRHNISHVRFAWELEKWRLLEKLLETASRPISRQTAVLSVSELCAFVWELEKLLEKLLESALWCISRKTAGF